MVSGEQTVIDVKSFKPSQFENLTLWLDANDVSTLFQDNNGATPVTKATDNVKLWKDKSGNNNNVINQSGNTPKYQNNGKVISQKNRRYKTMPSQHIIL